MRFGIRKERMRGAGYEKGKTTALMMDCGRLVLGIAWDTVSPGWTYWTRLWRMTGNGGQLRIGPVAVGYLIRTKGRDRAG